MKTPIPTRIDANKSTVSSLLDLDNFSRIVFPAKNACDLRAAMILILMSLKHSPHKKLTSKELDREREEKASQLSQKTLWKARATLSRLGLIERREMTFWRISSRFGNSLRTLADKVNNLMTSAASEKKDQLMLDIALAECEVRD